MPGRKSRYLEIDPASIIDDGILRFNGRQASCPDTNAPTLSSDGTLTLHAPLRQANSVKKVAGVHDYVVQPLDTTLLVDSSWGPITITLPEIDANLAGREVTIKDGVGIASKQFITINTGSQIDLIEGSLTLTISANYGYYGLLCDGESWLVMSCEERSLSV